MLCPRLLAIDLHRTATSRNIIYTLFLWASALCIFLVNCNLRWEALGRSTRWISRGRVCYRVKFVYRRRCFSLESGRFSRRMSRRCMWCIRCCRWWLYVCHCWRDLVWGHSSSRVISILDGSYTHLRLFPVPRIPLPRSLDLACSTSHLRRFMPFGHMGKRSQCRTLGTLLAYFCQRQIWV